MTEVLGCGILRVSYGKGSDTIMELLGFISMLVLTVALGILVIDMTTDIKSELYRARIEIKALQTELRFMRSDMDYDKSHKD